MNAMIGEHLLDMICLVISAGIFTFYQLFVWWMLKTNPAYTLYGASTLAKTAWVVSIMEDRKDILAVQTLRNSTMAATFLASTSVLLAVGLLTLSGQSDKMGQIWHSVNVLGSTTQSTMALKMLVILVDLFIAFFSFSFSIRLYNHVGFLINTPPMDGNYGTSITFVSMQLNKAGGYFHIGMRAYYFLIPLVFWMFGPLLMVLSTVIMVVLVFRIEKTPKMDCGYLAAFFRQTCAIPKK